MFTYNTKPKLCYTTKSSNMVVSQDKLSVPTQALLAFISAERGLEYHTIVKKAFDRNSFADALRQLRKKLKGQKVCLFLDQLGIHTHPDTEKVFDELDFRVVFNLTYSPDFNPIETLFSKVKLKFLKLKLDYLVADGNQLTPLEMVEESLKTMTPESCSKAVKLAPVGLQLP